MLKWWLSVSYEHLSKRGAESPATNLDTCHHEHGGYNYSRFWRCAVLLTLYHSLKMLSTMERMTSTSMQVCPENQQNLCATRSTLVYIDKEANNVLKWIIGNKTNGRESSKTAVFTLYWLHGCIWIWKRIWFYDLPFGLETIQCSFNGVLRNS